MNARNLRVDSGRLWTTIMETAAIGATPKGGIRRLALSDEDARVRAWFRAAAEAAGCAVMVDTLGNVFARRLGRDTTLPPIAIGSHLDTQPTGGKFDGVIGVLAGLEIVRLLNDAGIETNAPIEIVNWTNEEGARFSPAMLGSGVFAGVLAEADALATRDRAGALVGEELARIGWRGGEPCGAHALAAHFELHIEQGPVLEAERKTIGVVTGVQAICWFEARVTGRDGHAGATPMRLRRDALASTARMIAAVETVGLDHGPDAVATVGLIESAPNSPNVVPGDVFFTIDLRHPDDARLAAMETDLRAAFAAVATQRGVILAVDRVWAQPSVRFDPDCIAAVQAAADALGLPSRRLVSGAGHDSAHLARVAPTTMVFVPCADGLSHNEAESATQADVAAGADVLLRAVLAYDETLVERSSSVASP